MFHPLRDLNRHPDRAEVRAFGRVMTLGFLVIGAALLLLLRWTTGRWESWPLWLGGICGGLGSICWLAPALGRPIHVAWHALGGVIGFFVGNLLLVAVFYFILTPVGLLLRLLGRDPLERAWDANANTYWKDAEKPLDARSCFRQF